MVADLTYQTSEAGQELRPRSEIPATELLREVGAVLRMSEADAAALADQSMDPDARDLDDDETMIINMGPQHPSTHGVLRLMLELRGETVLRCKPIIGYLHTGMEKQGEQLTYLQGGTNVTRMDYLSPFFNELVFSMATEKLLGIDGDIPERAVWIRMLMSELNRMSSHLLFLATNGLDLGAVSMMIYGWREREEVLRFFQQVTGLRMNHNYVRPGGVAADLPPGWRDGVLRLLDLIPPRLDEYDTLMTGQPIWRERLQGVGVITPTEAVALAATGPTLRSTGVAYDIRRAEPYLHYDEVDFDVIVGSYGDAFDRYAIRINEVRESMRLVQQILDRMPGGDYRIQDKKVTPPPRARIDESMEALIHHFKLFTEGFKVPTGEVYVAVEGPRGELGCYLASDGSAKPYRLHMRAPSFVNIQTLPHMMRGRLVADAVAIISSIDPVSEMWTVEPRPTRRRSGVDVSRLSVENTMLGAGDHRALPAAEVGADPAAPPQPGAERLRHQRGDGAHRRAHRGDARRGVRHGDVLRDVPVRAGRQVPDQHLHDDVVCVARGRGAAAPRRAASRHQGRGHDGRRRRSRCTRPSARRPAPRRRACRSTTAIAIG